MKTVYSHTEKEIFKQLVMSKNIIFSHKLRGSAMRDAKARAWQQITNDFNSIQGVNKRTVVQLKKLWQNLKAAPTGSAGGCDGGYNGTSQNGADESFIVLPTNGDTAHWTEGNTAEDSSDDVDNTETKPTLVPEQSSETFQDDIPIHEPVTVLTQYRHILPAPPSQTHVIPEQNVIEEPKPEVSEQPPKRRRKKDEHEGTSSSCHCNQIQEKLDPEMHTYLKEKAKYEAELAKLLMQNAKAEESRKVSRFQQDMKISETEEERKKINFENEQRFLDEKRKIELRRCEKEIEALEAEEERRKVKFEQSQKYLDELDEKRRCLGSTHV